jgi:hypothetical protein
MTPELNVDSGIVLGNAIVTLICTTYLVIHEDYDDGAFGRLFLVAAWFVSLQVAYGIIWVGERFSIDALFLTLMTALTLTVSRTTAKFYMFHRWGISSWKERSDRTGGYRSRKQSS